MMSKTNLAIFLGMLVLSFPMMLCAETPKISEEVLAAKSIAILVRLVDPIGVEADGFKDLLRARAEDRIRQKKRFQIVTDPAQADLVCLLLVYQPSWTLTKHDPTKYTMLPLANSVIILKGGNSRHWDASPVWTGIAVIINPVAAGKPGDDHRGLLSTFHDYLRGAEKSPKHAGNASQVGNSSERVTADERRNLCREGISSSLVMASVQRTRRIASIGLLALTKDNGTWWMNRLRRISWWSGMARIFTPQAFE
jgi:hypothetical protein